MKENTDQSIIKGWWRVYREMTHGHPLRFTLIWFALFLLVFVGLSLFGLVPYLLSQDAPVIFVPGSFTTTLLERDGNLTVADRTPTYITIPSVGVNTPIGNPTSRDISVLDNALTKGAVHYPGSGLLGSTGNVFLFGHSTGFRIVNNQAYRAFNNIKNLKVGDTIRVRSNTSDFIYTVRSVRHVAADDAWIDLRTNEKLLTLSTCDSFGQKQDRYVVEAVLSVTKTL